MNIALDIDGVIIDFVSSFISTLKKRMNISLKYEEIYCHDITQVLALPKSDVDILLQETLYNNHFKLIDHAKESIDYLYQHHHVSLITSRSEKYREQTEKLLSEHNIKFQSLYFASYLNKHQVIPFDFFVEDSVEEAVSLSQTDGEILVYRHPWNERSLNTKKLFRYVNNWHDIIKEIESHG